MAKPIETSILKYLTFTGRLFDKVYCKSWAHVRSLIVYFQINIKGPYFNSHR